MNLNIEYTPELPGGFGKSDDYMYESIGENCSSLMLGYVHFSVTPVRKSPPKPIRNTSIIVIKLSC